MRSRRPHGAEENVVRSVVESRPGLFHRAQLDLEGTAQNFAKAEGFALNHDKTRIMRRGGCQRITGLVVNQHLNVPRADFDALKATLHNCLRHGPERQNRDGHADFRAHLDGRITWVENVNPRRGLRLRRMFENIQWSDRA